MTASGRPFRPSSIKLAVGSALLLILSAQAAGGQSVVHGTIADDDTRQPIATAELRLVDAGGTAQARALSDNQGRFRLEVARSGPYVLTVTRVGYARIEAHDIQVGEGAELELQIRLAAEAVVLDAVSVVVQRRAEWGRLGQFHQRAELNRNMGRGRIYMRSDVERIRPATVEELIDNYSWGIRCRPVILLNGMPTDGSIFGVRPDQLEGLELYRQNDHIPPEYYQSGMCGLALLWTRGDPGVRPWSWARVAAAGLLVALIAVMTQ
jgi:hypothetical protein